MQAPGGQEAPGPVSSHLQKNQWRRSRSEVEVAFRSTGQLPQACVCASPARRRQAGGEAHGRRTARWRQAADRRACKGGHQEQSKLWHVHGWNWAQKCPALFSSKRVRKPALLSPPPIPAMTALPDHRLVGARTHLPCPFAAWCPRSSCAVAEHRPYRRASYKVKGGTDAEDPGPPQGLGV